MKEFKKKLVEMGFKRKSPRVFWYDNNGLFYVVSFKTAKTEKGEEFPQVGFEVSHAGMFEDGIPAQRCSLVGGWACSHGVCNDAGYHDGKAPDGVFLERMAREYFTYFKTAADWKTAITTLRKEEWAHGNPIDDAAGGMSPFWFTNDMQRELRNYEEFAKDVDMLFDCNFEKWGFRRLERGVYARKRGEVYDCLALYCDDVFTFFYGRAYIWCEQFGADGWPSSYSFTNDYVPGLIRTADFLRDASIFDALLEKATAFTEQFATLRDYVDYLKDNGNLVAKKRWEKLNALLG